MNTNIRSSRLLFLLLFIVMSFQAVAQIAVLPPEPAGGTTSFSKICAGIDSGSGPFNSYDITIAWGGTAEDDNVFILELSDADGDFTNAVELGRATDQNDNSPKTFDINFAIPTDTQGKEYKFRTRSTNPESEAESADSYQIYYMDFTTSLNISELGDGVAPGSVCADESVELKVDNITNIDNYDYQWFRGGSVINGETSYNIIITSSGSYNVLIDYGDCSFNANTDSNFVTVTIGGTDSVGVGIGITTPSTTELCAGQTEVLTIDSTDPDWSYQWYKDSVAILGETGTSYTVDGSVSNFEGDYQVEVSGDGACSQRSEAVTMSNLGGFTVTTDNAASIVILPAQTETLSVSTSASSPTYQWYKDLVMVSGATSATLDITQEGTYYCAVTSTGVCSSAVNSEETVAIIPTSFTIVIDYDASYIACESTNATLEVATINAIAPDGSSSDVTGQLETEFTYQWQLNGVNITGATSATISLTDTTENGDYTVDAILSTYNATSNMLPVQLLTNETVTITSTSTIYCSDTETITISTTADLTTETFSWEKDGAAVNNTDSSLTVSETGSYRLMLSREDCSLYSNTIEITPLDSDLISVDVDGDIVFQEGSSKTVTASGGTSYEWYDENNTLLSSTDQYTFTVDGNYILVASIDNCQVTKQLTAAYLDLFNVPNVITPNGDGANDQWVIPNTYSNDSDITVIIYTEKGVELINQTSYSNDWPQSTTSFTQQNMVFYYVIKSATETLKQGTITVIR